MFKDYPQIISTIKNTPWLIVPENLEILLDIVNMRLNGQAFSDEEIRLRLEALETDEDTKDSRVEIGGGIGIIPLQGPIFGKANLMTALSGATSLEMFRSDFRGLMENDSVEKIVMDIDSPGGTSDLVMEMGQEIRKAREIKPVYAVANTMAGSAAYWLASQATKMYCTPSGKVGSIGVYSIHEDTSRQDENAGRKITLVYAGKFKTAGNPHEPLTQEARDYMQESVDATYAEFIDEVAFGRNVSSDIVKDTFGKGKMLHAKPASEVGMVDGVASLDEVLGSLFSQRSTPIPSGPTALEYAALSSIDSTRLEHVGEEHSEPGTGNPPQPREVPVERDAEQGWRRDQPPIIQELEARGTKEGSKMSEELEARLREVLSLSADASIVDAVTSLTAEVQPLRELAQTVGQKRQFAEMFPEQAKELEEARKDRMETQAKMFSERLLGTVIKDKEGKETTKGFTSIVAQCAQTLHLNMAEGSATVADVEAFVEAVANNGIVDLSEKGSSQSRELRYSPAGQDARTAFAELVKEIQEEDKLEFEAALKVAAERDPELALAYHESAAKR